MTSYPPEMMPPRMIVRSGADAPVTVPDDLLPEWQGKPILTAQEYVRADIYDALAEYMRRLGGSLGMDPSSTYDADKCAEAAEAIEALKAENAALREKVLLWSASKGNAHMNGTTAEITNIDAEQNKPETWKSESHE